MAKISASSKFTLNGLDFSTLQDTDPELFNNVFETFKGKRYEDVLTLRDEEEAGANFGGTNLALTNAGSAKSGKVQLIEGVGPGDESVFDIRGLDLKLTKIDSAISTNSFKDDLAIWKEQFAGKDTMVLSNAGDNMRGFGGNDVMKGRGGSDRLFGDGGNDALYGGSGKDSLEGGTGADSLYGGDGDDILKGSKGNDKLFGGIASDTLIGGSGADVFVFDGVGGADTVKDFGKGNDMLRLKNDIAGTEGLTKAEIVDEFASKSDGNIIFQFNSGDTLTLEGYTKLGTLDDFIL